VGKGYKEGIKTGRKEGRVEEKLAIARTALVRGFTVEDVRNIAGPDPDTVNKNTPAAWGRGVLAPMSNGVSSSAFPYPCVA
jgi:hypothetical protein